MQSHGPNLITIFQIDFTGLILKFSWGFGYRAVYNLR
jgi:hypothetical protein